MAFWNTVLDAQGDAVPNDKQLLVPVLVDEIAKSDPERICFSFSRSMNVANDFQNMNFRTFANAINKIAHFIHREIGRSSMFETVLYMGHPDVRHYIILVAFLNLKAELKPATRHVPTALAALGRVLFTSHRNSVAAHADLIKRTDCTILLHTAGFPVSGILEKCRMETLCMPELDYLLNEIPCEHYPYTRSFEEARQHPCLVIQTSASTGSPKPVTWTLESLSVGYAHHKVQPIDGRQNIWGAVLSGAQRNLTAFPAYQGCGVVDALRSILFNKNVIVIGPPGLTTADVFDQVLDYANIDAASCLASTLEDIAKRPDVLSKLRKLRHVCYFGGSLSEEAGDILSNHVQLYRMVATMESNILVQHETDRKDWRYICLNETQQGIQMRARSNLHELVFVKNSEVAEFQGPFHIFPNLTEYSMSELYSKHPTKQYHWKHEGRIEDMIVLRNGWNFNPIIHERSIMSHPCVQNCILVGTGRDKPAAIIELKSESYTEEEMAQRHVLGAIWPNIQEANRAVDVMGQLGHDYIIFAKKNKPFKIAVHGTVRRKSTGKMYEFEIEELYARLNREGARY